MEWDQIQTMKLETILTIWGEDCKIDSVALDIAALNIPMLHGNYLKIYSDERLLLRSMKLKYKSLNHLLTEYFKGDLNSPKDLEEMGRQPWARHILKNEIQKYVDADNEMVSLQIKMAVQEEKVQVLEEIMKSINNRGFQISNAIKWRSLTNFGTL